MKAAPEGRGGGDGSSERTGTQARNGREVATREREQICKGWTMALTQSFLPSSLTTTCPRLFSSPPLYYIEIVADLCAAAEFVRSCVCLEWPSAACPSRAVQRRASGGRASPSSAARWRRWRLACLQLPSSTVQTSVLCLQNRRRRMTMCRRERGSESSGDGQNSAPGSPSVIQPSSLRPCLLPSSHSHPLYSRETIERTRLGRDNGGTKRRRMEWRRQVEGCCATPNDRRRAERRRSGPAAAGGRLLRSYALIASSLSTRTDRSELRSCA